MTALDKALGYFEEHQAEYLERLKTLVRIPGVSAWDSHRPELDKSAEAVRQELEKAGLEKTEILEVGDAPPYAYGEWLGAPGKPTLLLYAHHDVQPPGEDQRWLTEPFVPVEKQGPNGLRLYGRGSADDKAGAMCHVAAIEAWMKTAGELPCNVKVLIEGEEEIGSTHLSQCLKQHQEKLMADVLVLTDTTNFDTGVPSLTYSLRGLISVDVELRTVDHAIHSGMWGGPILDPLYTLCQLIGTLHDQDGRIAVEGFYDNAHVAADWESERIAGLDYGLGHLRKESGMLEATQLAGESERHILERIWHRPSITVIGLDACPLAVSANKILPVAKARLSCRVGPGQDPGHLIAALEKHLKKHVRYGAELNLSFGDGCPGWLCQPSGPAFEAAERALEAGFGKKVALIGCGGSIPFVGPFAEAFGGAPALLLGLEDPYTNAHGENESLHIGDFNKLMNSSVRLLQELSTYKKP